MSRYPLVFIPILAILLLLLLGLERYIYQFLLRLTPQRWKHRRLLHLPAVLLGIASLNLSSTFGIILLHFWLISMLVTLAWKLLRKLGAPTLSALMQMLLPFLITLVFIGWGFYNIAHPVQTNYTIETTKPIRPEGWRIALITDVHYDTIQDPQLLQQAIPTINAQHPDFIVLGGDIVEEGTSRQRMQEVFQVLSQLEAPTYFVYGNHDQQNYSNTPAYSHQELEDAVRNAGITILADSEADIQSEVLLYGRIDPSMPNRSPLPSLTDPDCLVVIADHQPNAWVENATAGGDLQLSGHTHAGQIWPIGQFLELAGGLSYGRYDRDGITAIVSSGFAGWGFTMRTSERCEFAIIDIVPKHEA